MRQVHFRQSMMLVTIIFEKRKLKLAMGERLLQLLPSKAQYPVWLWLVWWALISEDSWAPKRWLLAASLGTSTRVQNIFCGRFQD